MSAILWKGPPPLAPSDRMQSLAQRSRELAISGKRRLGSADMPLGDHACWIDIGPFPQLDQMPSKVDGYEATGESWGRDYAFLVDHFPVEIYANERIVGEIHWEMLMVRQYVWPDLSPAALPNIGGDCLDQGLDGRPSGGRYIPRLLQPRHSTPEPCEHRLHSNFLLSRVLSIFLWNRSNRSTLAPASSPRTTWGDIRCWQ